MKTVILEKTLKTEKLNGVPLTVTQAEVVADLHNSIGLLYF